MTEITIIYKSRKKNILTPSNYNELLTSFLEAFDENKNSIFEFNYIDEEEEYDDEEDSRIVIRGDTISDFNVSINEVLKKTKPYIYATLIKEGPKTDENIPKSPNDDTNTNNENPSKTTNKEEIEQKIGEEGYSNTNTDEKSNLYTNAKTGDDNEKSNPQENNPDNEYTHSKKNSEASSILFKPNKEESKEDKDDLKNNESIRSEDNDDDNSDENRETNEIEKPNPLKSGMLFTKKEKKENEPNSSDANFGEKLKDMTELINKTLEKKDNKDNGGVEEQHVERESPSEEEKKEIEKMNSVIDEKKKENDILKMELEKLKKQLEEVQKTNLDLSKDKNEFEKKNKELLSNLEKKKRK